MRLVNTSSGNQSRTPELQVVDGSTSRLMDEVCLLVSHLTGASMVVIARGQPGERLLKVIGRTGTLVNEFDMHHLMAVLNPHSAPLLLSPDVRADPRLSGDPLLDMMPHVKSLIAMLVPVADTAAPTVLYVANPRKSSTQDGTLMQILSDLGAIVRDILVLRSSHTRELADLRQGMADRTVEAEGSERFNEAHNQESLQADVRAAATFLFETLVKRRGLHSRKGADYVSLRTWRLPVKKYQISALIAIKEGPSHGFVLRVADELAAHVRQAHGESVIRSVVPVPPGSSGKPDSLSIMLAEAVAKLLGAHYCNALMPVEPVPLGKSTPRKSAHLAGYRLQQPVEGPVLIIDDVASSGRHIELAINACKSPTTAVYALVWIGK